MENVTLREAGPNETRCIVRHALGYYTNICVGGVYRIPKHLVSEQRIKQTDIYIAALTECIDKHPFLLATIQNAGTNNPTYTRPQSLDLQDHVRFLPVNRSISFNSSTYNDTRVVHQQVLHDIHNDPEFAFESVESTPAWSLNLLVLSHHSTSNHFRILISFVYSHSHGDGLSGSIFHKTFREALQNSLKSTQALSNAKVSSGTSALPERPDSASNMPISIMYLLQPALGTYLPGFLTRWFGISSNVSGATDKTWTGSRTFTDSNSKSKDQVCHTSVEYLRLEPILVRKLLARCRKEGAKLTPLLSTVIAKAMEGLLRPLSLDQAKHTNFVATIPVNLRSVLGFAEDVIGNFGGAAYLNYDLSLLSTELNGEFWDRVRHDGDHLRKIASSARDQPLGLLRFVSNYKNWMEGQVGGTRDCSWELSNLGSFDSAIDTSATSSKDVVDIEEMYFSQPASVVGPPLTFNALSVQDGPLAICIGWQLGSLDLTQTDTGVSELDAKGERRVIVQVADNIRAQLNQLVSKE